MPFLGNLVDAQSLWTPQTVVGARAVALGTHRRGRHRAHPPEGQPMTARRARRRIAGFTLDRGADRDALMGVILGALATVTAQWMPKLEPAAWARSSAARFWGSGWSGWSPTFRRPNSSRAAAIPAPVFDGTELSMTFVRSALGPNTRSGLELVRIGEIGSDRGPQLVRARTRFVPVTADTANDQPSFADPVVLIRAPYRVTFAYCGARQGLAQPVGAAPANCRRRSVCRCATATTDRILQVSTATMVHAEMPPDCILGPKVINDCLNREAPEMASAPPPRVRSRIPERRYERRAEETSAASSSSRCFGFSARWQHSRPSMRST